LLVTEEFHGKVAGGTGNAVVVTIWEMQENALFLVIFWKRNDWFELVQELRELAEGVYRIFCN
jgi:hypothetical protein